MWPRSKLVCARLAVLTVALGTSACVRPPLEPGCPTLGAGDLVISEIRGEQAGTDTRGQWVELYNASAASVALAGVQLVLRPLASAATTITVRDRQLSIASGGYSVLAVDRVCSSEACVDRLPPDADYGFGDDYTRDLPAGAIVEVWSCGVLVDSLLYRALPDTGSLSLSGAAPPDAALNDVASDDAGEVIAPFCADETEATGGGTEVGLPGTPGAPNLECP